MKKNLTALMIALLCFCLFFSGCSNANPENTDKNTTAVVVRYLNFKPEIASVYEEIADAYQKETGKQVIVETAANNTYEQTLTAKMASSSAPTIFQINGPRGYANWKKYCADMRGTKLYQHLTDKSLAVTAGDGVYGIPNVVEGYGIIYNDAIMRAYFALPERATSYTSMEDINSFEALKALAEDLQAHRDALGIKGAFASTSLKPGEEWRWHTHLANVALSYEFEGKNADLASGGADTIDFAYADNFKNIFDLYLNNSTVEPKTLGTKIVDESMAEFALGQCAMVQNGNWAWSQISQVSGNTVKAEDIKYLPIYMGLEGEENQGICIGTENFLCINSKASEEEQAAADDFLFWLYSSDTGRDFVTNRLNFIAPFDTFEENERPEDPLAKEVLRWMEKENIKNIPWNFTVFPGQTFKEDFGSALLQYAQGSKSWEEVKATVVKRWNEESAAL